MHARPHDRRGRYDFNARLPSRRRVPVTAAALLRIAFESNNASDRVGNIDWFSVTCAS